MRSTQQIAEPAGGSAWCSTTIGYHDQKQALEKYFERTNRDIWVGSCGSLDRDGEMFTWTTWTEGVASLLPRAELLGVTRENGDRVIVDWDKAMTVAGDCFVAQDEYPPRFLVERFANDAQWQELVALDTAPRPERR